MMQLARRVALIGALVAGIATGALAQGFDKVFEAYSNGKVAEAVKGFKALAGKGDARAQQMLGRIYSDPESGVKNDAEAIKWYKQAADRGDAVAQVALGSMYVDGIGVKQDYGEAYKWLYLVVTGEDITVANRAMDVYGLIEKLVTKDQIAAAEAFADNWQPKN